MSRILVSQINQNADWRSAVFAGYNVKAYGAVGDGQQVQTATISSGSPTLTATGAGFVAADIGKVVVVEGAGASGLDLVTTIIARTSATVVTLNANAGTSATNKTATWGTNDTVAIQAAVDIISTTAGGTLYFPNGIYMISGGLVTSRDSQTYNAQITLPYRVESLPSVVMEFAGQSRPTGPYLQYTGQPPPKNGVILFSTITGSGTRPAIIGGPQLAADHFSHFTPMFTNMTFRLQADPSLDALDLLCMENTELEHVGVDVMRNTYDLPAPTHTGQVGIRLPGRTNDARISVSKTYVMGQYTGAVMNEHTIISDSFIQSCMIGLESTEAYHSMEIVRLCLGQCPHGIKFTGGASYLRAHIDFERYPATGGPAWMNPVADIDDVGNLGHGQLWYNSVHGGVGTDGVLSITGATNLNITWLGTPP